MNRRKKKDFPPGTFLPTGARILAIVQLCLAFTCVVWSLGYPFLGLHFEVKEKKLMYEKVIKDEKRFGKLTQMQQKRFLDEYDRLQKTETFTQKLQQGIEIFFKRISKFELIWILLAIVLPIALLKKREGAVQASWLLPITAFAFAFDNGYHGSDPNLLPENKLFPTEKVIMNNFLNSEESAKSILDQRKQLLRGWERYLIKEWAHEIPSLEPAIYARQVSDGDFAFSVERLNKLERGSREYNIFREKRNPLVLWLYVLWNLFFAGYIQFILGLNFGNVGRIDPRKTV